MFVNVNPTNCEVEETYCSLNFANRVRQVELGKSVKNATQNDKRENGTGADDDDVLTTPKVKRTPKMKRTLGSSRKTPGSAIKTPSRE